MRQLLNFLLALCVSATVAQADTKVFAAASLKSALDEVIAAYGKPVTPVYANSASLARQISQGAPADVFISANQQWMDVLDAQSLLVPDTRRDLLGNRLVLIAHTPVTDFDWAAFPAQLAEARLAMGLVAAVPAGIYGREALTAMGIWHDVAPRVVQTDHVRAALRLVALGEAEFGLVYASDAHASDRVHVVALIDAARHTPIRYPVALINARPEAQDFVQFLTGDAARDIFADHGFQTGDLAASGGAQ
ncbi:molybdate ABC transporter substrate-binding protein [Cognatishimia sp. SS12]|uniref:molybdate ABC transporter substrate-binding protein n=1 Tax=Cognatishimia sp. SS12 TaxID=2979465 RepID=UPI00232EA4EF|nr:molybdate ABC transporter substrate-binding protein [Cognatishimia sp. SS12]MDC0736680.1 molybdate ABC transporter substrate-binding protein [Cognatishimia sp. SS12]